MIINITKYIGILDELSIKSLQVPNRIRMYVHKRSESEKKGGNAKSGAKRESLSGK